MESRLPRHRSSNTLTTTREHARGGRRSLGARPSARTRGRGNGTLGRARDGAGERQVAHAGSGSVDRCLGCDLGVGLRSGSLRVEHVVNHVDDAVGDQDVGLQELGRVDVHVVSGVQDGDVLALGAEELGAVGQAGRVDYLVNGVVVHDGGDLVRGHGGDCGAEGLEGCVVGSEDGDVLGGGNRGHFVACV